MSATAIPLHLHFAGILAIIRRGIAPHTDRRQPQGRHLVRTWNYIGRLIERFERLLRTPYRPRPPRPEAGPPRAEPPAAAPTLETPPPETPAPETPPPDPPDPLLMLPDPSWRPRGPKHWLLRCGIEVAAGASQLRAMLDRPDAQALLRDDPRVARMLRPLCHALGVDLPPGLDLPRPRRTRPKPAADTPKSPRRRRERDPNECPYPPGSPRAIAWVLADRGPDHPSAPRPRL